jgi:hypothetical protein
VGGDRATCAATLPSGRRTAADLNADPESSREIVTQFDDFRGAS